ncbi:TIGR04086 family membrane protein [Natronincola ferrireducens]|uniref:Putative membrane protein, TIGR04086 family n=1 Tax=Natronincola ferrireducens TaxID=393762 RepID=A0A1G9CY99_9FIRM|nr:TIGR04086 family membrane protein [Natronincola ferrireducens]SDK56384.1 putative membrane protein, TIGR04086 family [Natronincola ferrireducens]
MKGSITRGTGDTFNIWVYGKGLIRGYVLSLILFLLSGILITYTSLGEGIIPILTSVIMILSIAYASIYTAVHTKKRGWLQGAVIGLIYILILIIFSKVFITDYIIDTSVYYRVIIGIVTGVIGGMIGINLK